MRNERFSLYLVYNIFILRGGNNLHEGYMNGIEEIINIEFLLNRFERVVVEGKLGPVIAEIVQQSKVEFNYEEEQ